MSMTQYNIFTRFCTDLSPRVCSVTFIYLVVHQSNEANPCSFGWETRCTLDMRPLTQTQTSVHTQHSFLMGNIVPPMDQGFNPTFLLRWVPCELAPLNINMRLIQFLKWFLYDVVLAYNWNQKKLILHLQLKSTEIKLKWLSAPTTLPMILYLRVHYPANWVQSKRAYLSCCTLGINQNDFEAVCFIVQSHTAALFYIDINVTGKYSTGIGDCTLSNRN